MAPQTQALYLLLLVHYKGYYIIKDTNQQPVEEVHGAKTGRILSTGTSVPAELGFATLLHVDTFTDPEAFQSLLCSGFHGGFITQT